LNDASDELGLGVVVQGCDERVTAGLPLMATIEPKPNQSMYANAGFPSRFYNIIVKALLVTGAVKTNVAAAVSGADVLKFFGELRSALAGGDLVTEADKCIFGGWITPPVVER